MRFDRCPWGTKLQNKIHLDRASFHPRKDMKVEDFELDVTRHVISETERLIADVGLNEAIDKDANATMQAEWLSTLKAKYDK